MNENECGKCGGSMEIIGNSLCVTCDWEDRRLRENREFVEKNGAVFAAHEGLCLTCYRETNLVEVAGTEAFHSSYHYADIGTIKYRTWNEIPDGDGMDDIGCLTYQCPEGHKTDVYCNPHGDWNVA